MEMDSAFATDIKRTLQQWLITKYVVAFVGGGPNKRIVTPELIEFYLQVNKNIHIKASNVLIDFERWLVFIKLSDLEIVKINIRNTTGIKTVTVNKKV